MASRTGRPVLDLNLTHGKVIDVRRRERRANAGGGGRDQAIGLMEGYAL